MTARLLRVLGCLAACAMVAVGVTELGRGLEWFAHALNVAGH